MQELHIADWTIIALFGVLMIFIGVVTWRFSSQSDNYFTAGRKIPWWVSGISSWMSAFSAWVFVGVGSMCYTNGIAPMIHVLYAPAFAYFVGAYLWAHRWRRTGVVTVPEFIEKRFSASARQLFAWTVTPFRIFDDGVKCYATAKILSVIFHLPMAWTVVGLISVTLLYTMMGGLWAVMITDTVQFLILVTTVVVVVPAGLMRIGGLEGLMTQSPEHFFSPFAGDFSVAYLIASWLFHPFLYNGSFSLVQRYTTVRTAWEAKKVALLAGSLCFLFFPIIIAPAMIYRIIDPSLLQGVGRSEEAYIRMCLAVLPAGMIGMVAVTLLSATMSTLSGDFNIYGGVLTYDFYHRLIDRNASTRKLMRVGRLMTIAVGLLSFFIALNVEKWGGAFKVMMTIIGAMAGPTAVPILFGLMDRRASATAAISSLVVGLTVAFISKVIFAASYPVFVLSNLLATTAVYLIHRAIFPVTGPAKEKVDRLFENEIENEGAELAGSAAAGGAEAEKVAVPPAFRIVGVVTGIIGAALGVIGLFQGMDGGLKINGVVALILMLAGGFLVTRVQKD